MIAPDQERQKSLCPARPISTNLGAGLAASGAAPDSWLGALANAHLHSEAPFTSPAPSGSGKRNQSNYTSPSGHDDDFIGTGLTQSQQHSRYTSALHVVFDVY